MTWPTSTDSIELDKTIISKVTIANNLDKTIVSKVIIANNAFISIIGKGIVVVER